MKPSLNARWIRIIAAALAVVILGGVWAWRTYRATPSDSKPGTEVVITPQVDRGLSEEQQQVFRDRIAEVETQVNDNETNGTRDISLILALGNLQYQLGELDAAASWYRNILTTNPNDAPALENLGQVLVEMGDYAGAEAAWRSALNIEAYEPVYIKLSDLISEQFPERASDIQDILETAIANLGQTPGLLTRLGRWYESQGMLDEAISHYSVASKLDPDDQTIIEELNRLKALRSQQAR